MVMDVIIVTTGVLMLLASFVLTCMYIWGCIMFGFSIGQTFTRKAREERIRTLSFSIITRRDLGYMLVFLPGTIILLTRVMFQIILDKETVSSKVGRWLDAPVSPKKEENV